MPEVLRDIQDKKLKDAGEKAAPTTTRNNAAQPDKRSFLAVIAPKAGSYKEDLGQEITDAFAEEGLTVDFYSMEDTGQIEAEIAQALKKGYYSFLAIGGDGTVGLLAGSLYGKPHRLGIIPAGTTNTLARILGIPLNIKEAIQTAATSTNTRTVDGLEVNGKISIMNVSSGLSAVSMNSVDSKQKTRFGILAYLLGILRNRRRIREQRYKVQIDGYTRKIKAVELHVTNVGAVITPQLRIFPGSRTDDGKAEVLAIRRWSFIHIFNAILDILTRRKRQGIHLVGQGKEILIASDTPITAQADGDALKEAPIKIRVVPQAVNIIVP